MSLRLIDISDRELLHIVDDLGDNEGWVSAEHLCKALGLDPDYPNRTVASRFVWLRRFGVVEKRKGRKKASRGEWRLSKAGLDLIDGKLDARAEARLKKLSDGELWGEVAALADHRLRMRQVSARMLRREMQRSIMLR